MKTARKKITALVIVIIIIFILIYLSYTKQGIYQINQIPQNRSRLEMSNQNKSDNFNPMAKVVESYLTPIEFYGKVIDQNSNPIEGATIEVLPFDQPFGESESKSKMNLNSTADGRFSVKNIKGLAMGVVIRKQGYLEMPDFGLENPASSRRIEYGLDGSGGKRFKDPNNPTLFTLHKIGVLEPIMYIDDGAWHLPTDGNAKCISLDSIKGEGIHQIEFRFDTDWAKIPKDSDALFGVFNWKLELKIPGGGFVRNKSDFAFEAPEFGYEEKISFTHPINEPNWEKGDGGRYFVRFSDGAYARIRFSICANSDTRQLLMTSWLNLNTGSRNLNSDKKNGGVMMDE
jgi:hypothetical protein